MNKNLIKSLALYAGMIGVSGVMTHSLAYEIKNNKITTNNYTTRESQIVDIPDINLKKAINSALKRGETLEDITISDMESLKTLNLYGKNISNIEGLEYAVNLTNLQLYNNQISDISALENLNKLNILNIGSNQITNISPLANLENLTNLQIYRNKISDISILKNLTGLTNLILDNNQISDISILENLTSLSTLYLNNNH